MLYSFQIEFAISFLNFVTVQRKDSNIITNNMALPSKGISTDKQPAGDHMYNLFVFVQTASRI